MTLADKMADYSISPPTGIIDDGKLHRFKSQAKGNNKNGWYVLFDGGGFQAGSFGCWKQGINEKFISVDKSQLTKEQKNNMPDKWQGLTQLTNKKKSTNKPKPNKRHKHDLMRLLLIILTSTPI